MKLKNIDQVNELISAVDECKGDVFITSEYGDKFNLKSKLSQYVAIAALIGDHAQDLELWCTDKEDEYKMLKFLDDHSEILE